jgi:antitoxin component YwqK of YwqJK toxin-antitoxin module
MRGFKQERFSLLKHKTKLLLLAFFSFIVIASCNKKPSKKTNSSTSFLVCNINNTNLSRVNDVVYYQGNKFTGKLFSLFNNTTDTQLIANYQDGVEHGEQAKWYSPSQLYEWRKYNQGKKSDSFLRYWPNGQLQLKYFFTHNETEGEAREWTANGLLVKNMHYKNGYEEGLQQQWYETGIVKSNYLMISGRRYGLLGTKNCVNVMDSLTKQKLRLK